MQMSINTATYIHTSNKYTLPTNVHIIKYTYTHTYTYKMYHYKLTAVVYVHIIPGEDLLTTVSLGLSDFASEVTWGVSLGEDTLSFISTSCFSPTAVASFSATSSSVFAFFCYSTYSVCIRTYYVYNAKVNIPIEVSVQSLHWPLICEVHFSFQYVSLLHEIRAYII